MVRVLLSLNAILAVASAFSSPALVRSVSKPLFMFSAEDGKAASEKSAGLSQGLSEVMPGESADVLESKSLDASSGNGSAKSTAKKMQVLNRNTGEMIEVEMNESFLANESFEMNWWAWIGFVAFPVILLSNDVFHFLPTDGPLGFLGRI